MNATRTETLILGLLNDSRDEMYGLQLVEKSNGKLKKGTVYVTLNRMEEKGFIESRTQPQRDGARGLPRRLYKLTGLGQKVHELIEEAQSIKETATYGASSFA